MEAAGEVMMMLASAKCQADAASDSATRLILASISGGDIRRQQYCPGIAAIIELRTDGARSTELC